jgi:hypothetical protein
MRPTVTNAPCHDVDMVPWCRPVALQVWLDLTFWKRGKLDKTVKNEETCLENELSCWT